MERHGMFQHNSLKEFQDAIAIHIDGSTRPASISHPIAFDCMCWQQRRPHDCDVPLADILPVIREARVGASSSSSLTHAISMNMQR